MTPLPSLELYVTDDCHTCRRAEQTLTSCQELHDLVSLRVVHLDRDAIEPPAGVTSVPTVMCRGVVLALGTPDCGHLVETLRLLLAQTA
ncbi:MAG: hypothetical protein Kow0010_05390 [Dehalococcoidia bacterium]